MSDYEPMDTTVPPDDGAETWSPDPIDEPTEWSEAPDPPADDVDWSTPDDTLPPEIDDSVLLDLPPDLPPDIPPPDVPAFEPEPFDLPTEDPYAAVEPYEPPPVHEYETLVMQEPLSDDLVTVEDIESSDAYREWEATAGLSGSDDELGGLEPADPGLVGTTTMVGDTGDANFWFRQNEQNSCGPSSAAQIIGDFRGEPIGNEFALAARAQQEGLYDPASGMYPENLARLLTEEGVPSGVAVDQDFGDLEQYLREGRAVVMFVDGRDLAPADSAWALGDEPEDSATDSVNHFVRIIGIDRANNLAIIADPGQEGAAQLEVPLDHLEEAWDDITGHDGNGQPIRGHMLIVSEGSDPTPDHAATGPDPQPVPTPTPTPTPDPTPTTTHAPGPEPTDPGPITLPTHTTSTPGAPTPAAVPTPAMDPLVSPAHVAPVVLEVDDADPLPHVVAASVPERQAVEISLPMVDDVAAAPAAPAPLPPVDDDDDLFSRVPGWVLLPITLAAGRIGMALGRKK